MVAEDWQRFYSTEAERYEVARYGSAYGRAFRQAHREVVSELLATGGKRGAVLDVASGTGQLLPCAMSCGESIVACDLTPEMMKVSRNLYDCDSLAFIQADALKLPFADESFDLAMSSRFLHLFSPEVQVQILAEMRRVVKPGGLVVVDVYNSVARKWLSPAIALYRKITCKRLELDRYSSPNQARRMLEMAGLEQTDARGVGSYFILPFLWLPQKVVSRLLRSRVFTNGVMAEQWLVVGRRE